MSWIIEKATSPKVLDRSWRKFRRDNTVWRPGISRQEMEKQIIFHMMTLAEEMRNGTYMPDPVRSFFVNKGDNTRRLITAQTLRDKVAQRAVLWVIEPLGEKCFHPNSYAYRPGRSIDQVIERIQDFIFNGCDWALSADIMDCFDQVPHTRLFELVARLVQDELSQIYIQKWIRSSVSGGWDVFGGRRGIPQGAVISPFLCNLYLTQLDNVLSRKGIPFVRYADNLFIMAMTRQGICSVYEFLKMSLQRLGLELNLRKTKIFHISQGLSFLGQKIESKSKWRSVRIQHGVYNKNFAGWFK